MTERDAGASRHIVVLDDDAEMLRGVDRILSAAGFRVTATLSPKVAMEVVVCEAADAIISDLHMPEMGGHVVLAMLAQAAPRTARVLLTGETDFARVAALTVPYAVHAFVSKRDVSSRLVNIINELLARRPDDSDSGDSEEAFSLARGIMRTLALRDYETVEHCERVAIWSRRIASELALSPSRVVDVELGALLHDVGKIGVGDAVILKTGPLTDLEWEAMRRHPDLGAALLSEMPALRRAIPVVRCHHERRDGKGYPRGLVGNSIPLEARIFQIADTYDAITEDRPHRKGRDDQYAREEIAANVGPQFDPEVYDAFFRIDPQEWKSLPARPR